MNIQTLKYEIIEWITRTNDSFILQTLKFIKDSNASAADWFDRLNQEQIDSLNRGAAEHDRGDVLTSEEFWKGYEDKVQIV